MAQPMQKFSNMSAQMFEDHCVEKIKKCEKTEMAKIGNPEMMERVRKMQPRTARIIRCRPAARLNGCNNPLDVVFVYSSAILTPAAHAPIPPPPGPPISSRSSGAMVGV